MPRLALLTTAAAAAGALGQPLPKLHIVGPMSISGISSGADFAAQWLVAFSDVTSGAGAFAGQPFMCATTAFPTDSPLAVGTSCGVGSEQGPGCVGLNTTGAAPCVGCAPGMTIAYDHCKKTPAVIVPTTLTALAVQAAALGLIADVAHLASGHRFYAYRGTKDSVYLPGVVNQTVAVFTELGVAETLFEATIPTQHCQPSTDPSVPPSTCGREGGPLPGLENCGYDGAGEMLQFLSGGTLIQPPAGATSNLAELFNFSQALYQTGTDGGLGAVGHVYIPPACQALQACTLHVAVHGCGGQSSLPSVGLSYVLHSGYAQWADANNIVVLFAQAGGFAERKVPGPPQLVMGCYDGYGETGPAYAWRGGPQMAAVASMARALGGDAWWRSAPAATTGGREL